MLSQASRSSLEVRASSRNSQSIRNAQRLPRRSKSAIMGRPVVDPRTGEPGSGVGMNISPCATVFVARILSLRF